jgi:hypothetical protein
MRVAAGAGWPPQLLTAYIRGDTKNGESSLRQQVQRQRVHYHAEISLYSVRS